MRTLALIASIAATSFASAAPAPEQLFSVDTFGMAGSACEVGSGSVSLTDNGETLVIEHPPFIAEVYGNTDKTVDRLNCSITVALNYPQGYTFSVVEGEFSGNIHLDARTTGTQRATLWFAGSTNQRVFSTDFGPQNYSMRDVYTQRYVESSPMWQPCGENRALVINTEARVSNHNNRSGDAKVTLGTKPTLLKLKWERCY